MRIITLLVLFLGLTGISFLLTGVNTFCNLGQLVLLDGNQLAEQALPTGQAHHVFRLAQFWRDYPSLPRQLGALLSMQAALIVAGFCALCVWLLRLRLHHSWLATGIACLSIGPILYAFVIVALLSNTDPADGGRGLALAMLSSLYALLTCCGCCVLHLRPERLYPVNQTP